MSKVEITYPCHWSYKIIGEDENKLRDAAASVAGNKEFTVSDSNQSSGGKYHSLNLELTVDNETERLDIFKRLKKDAAIKFVL